MTLEAINNILTLIIPLAGAVVSVAMLVKALKIAPAERYGVELQNKEKEASVAVSMEELAERAASRALRTQEKLDTLTAELESLRTLKDDYEVLKKEVERLRKTNEAMQAELDIVRCEAENYRLENSALREWAEALAGQLKDASITPVPMKPHKRKDCRNV